MATQEIKDKKLAAATRELGSANTRLEKASGRLADFKAGYETKVKELEDSVTAARKTALTAAQKLEWVKGMPVDGGNVATTEQVDGGNVATDATEQVDGGNVVTEQADETAEA
jgi:hypothetical protein